MHEPGCVRRPQPAGDPDRQIEELSEREAAALLEELIERGSLDELHDEDRHVLVRQDIADPHDVGVYEGGLSPALGEKARAQLGALDIEQLEGEDGAEFDVANAIDRGDPPLPDPTHHLVAPDPLPDLHPQSVAQRERQSQRRADRARWISLGLGSLSGGLLGLLALALVYLPSGIAEPHRQSPMPWVLDTLPILLAWCGWLASSRRYPAPDSDGSAGEVDGALARALLDAVLVTDAQAKVIAANLAAKRFFGQSPVGRDIRDILVDFDRSFARERASPTGELIGLEWLFTARISPSDSSNDTPVCVCCAPLRGHRVLYVLSPERDAAPQAPATPERTLIPSGEDDPTEER